VVRESKEKGGGDGNRNDAELITCTKLHRGVVCRCQ
jgi:hypothetical protein